MIALPVKCTRVLTQNYEAIYAKNEDGTRKYRYIINTGGSRSSKTYSLIDIIDDYCRDNKNKRATVWRDTKTDCKKTVLHDILKHLKQTNRYEIGFKLNKTESILQYSTDSTFEIHGTDDEVTVHGLTQDLAWLNEPYKISRATFDQIDQRTADCIIIDWNPKQSHWIDDLLNDTRTIVIHSTFLDNPFCPEESRIKNLSYQPVGFSYVVLNKMIEEVAAQNYNCAENKFNFNQVQLKELARCQENERKRTADAFNWCVYGLGTKAEKPNRIFRFEEIPLQQFLQLQEKSYYGIDWGASDPWGIIEVKYYDGALYVRELNYISENLLRESLTITQRAQIAGASEGLVQWRFKQLGISTKSVVVCDNNREEKIKALRSIGYDYAIAALKPPGSILDGIDLLKDLRVYFTSDSKNFKHEQENYSREVDKYGVTLDEPEDTNNHLIDPLRYVAQFLRKAGIIKKV